MKSLLEKIKSLDKRIVIGIGAAAVVVVAVIIALVIVLGGRSDSDDSLNGDTGDAIDGTDNVSDVVSDDESDTDPDSESVNDIESDTETDSDTDTSDSDTMVEEDDTTGDEATVSTETDPITPVTNVVSGSTAPQTSAPSVTTKPEVTTQQTLTTNPSGEEILGQGSSGNPYLEIPGDDMTLTTVSIPAGKSLFYDIYRVGGMILTVNNANAYIVCDGTRYDAKGGVVSFKVPNALASDSVSFEIGNKGSSAASFKLIFANPTGSYANPTIISTLGGSISLSLEEGNEVGHFYKYKAAKNGTIRFYITESSVDSMLAVTNNNSMVQRTTESDVLTDESGRTYVELEVKSGDELIINIGAKPNKRGKYPAADIKWMAEYK